MKALIFAAGLGTRLKELTQNKPKALVEVNGVPMIQMVIEKIKSVGINDIYINIHHFGDQIIEFLEEHHNFNCNIQISDERDLLLNTGGGLKKVLQQLNINEDLLIHNVDIFSNFDIEDLIKFHKKQNNLVSLSVKKRETSRYLLFNNKMELKAWKNIKTGEIKPKEMSSFESQLNPFAFSGIHIINQRALAYFPDQDVFEIIPEYLKLANQQKVKALDMKCSMWLDLGKPESILLAQKYLSNKKTVSFINELASFLHEKIKPENFIQTCIITPNQRAGRFIKKAIVSNYPSHSFFPEILSIDEFIMNKVPFQKLEKIDLIFRLFPVIQKHIEEETNFNDFLNYASTLLQDFNELDMNMVSGEKVFSYLSEAKAIQQWNPDGGPLSDSQKEYLNFFNQLAVVYANYRDELAKTGSCYQGMAYRYLADHREILSGENEFTHLILAGFNALTVSEEIIIKTLVQTQNAHLIWDADQYYFADSKNEAGLYLRKHQKWTSTVKEQLKQHFKNNSKEISIIGSPGILAQCRLTAHLLLDHQKSDLDFLNETVIIPADENVLLPLLNSLPGEILKCANLSMGFPISYSKTYQLIDNIVHLHLGAQKLYQINQNQYRIYKDDLSQVLQNELIQLVAQKKMNLEHIPRFVSEQALTTLLENNGLQDIELIFSDSENIAFKINQNLLKLLSLIKQVISIDDFKQKYAQEFDAILKIIDSLIRLDEAFEQQQYEIDLMSYLNLFRQVIRQSKQAFIGQIENNLQIMGLLESRLMDFKNVILLSANEDILPSSSFSSSFIPLDIKYEFQLPGIQEKTAVFAYHFYRLIQRAEKVFILYSTSKRQLSGGEKSRFIKQLEFELSKANSKINFHHQLLSFDAPHMAGKEINIPKSEDLIQKLALMAKKGLSPTSINTYIKCPLQFYFKYLAKIKEPEQADDIVDERLFGNIIHDFLELEYKKFYKDDWTINRLHQLKNSIVDVLPHYFEKNGFKGDLFEGANYLDYKNIKHYLEQFLHIEIDTLKKNPDALHIIDLEKQLERKLEIKNGLSVLFKGRADRIDDYNGVLRILDYKTGSVEPKDLKLINKNNDNHHLAFNDYRFEKVIQLFMYKWMYGDILNTNIHMGIISFRNIKSPFLMLDNHKIRFEELEENFIHLVEEIFDPQISFNQTNNSDICTRCIYQNICQKY